MNELGDFVGGNLDKLSSDIGVGPHELQALYEGFEQNDPEGGDIHDLFGACINFPEATGFGSVYFAEAALQDQGHTLEGKRCVISGSGMLARSVATKLINKGALPVAFSDETGVVVEEHGFSSSDLHSIANITSTQGTLKEYAKANHKQFHDASSVWERAKGDLAFTCDIQNELNSDDAALLADNGCLAVIETSDRGCTTTAQEVFAERGVLFAPSKATSCGATVVSEQDPSLSKDQLDDHLEEHMREVYTMIRDTAERNGKPGNLRAGANLSAFIRIANSPMYLQK